MKTCMSNLASAMFFEQLERVEDFNEVTWAELVDKTQANVKKQTLQMFGNKEIAKMALGTFFPDHISKLEQVYEKHKANDEDSRKMNDALRWDRMNSNSQPSSDSKMNFIYNQLVNVDGGSVSHPELKDELDHRMHIDKVFEKTFPKYVENLGKEPAERKSFDDKLENPYQIDCWKELVKTYSESCLPETDKNGEKFIDEYGFKWYNAFVPACIKRKETVAIERIKEACKKSS